MRKLIFSMFYLFTGHLLFGQIDSITVVEHIAKMDSVFELLKKNDFKYTQRFDTLKFDAIVVSELDSNLLKMLKWHQTSNEKKKLKFRENNIYIVHIFPTTEWFIPKNIVDSIYTNNIFPLKGITPSYRIVIKTIDKRQAELFSIKHYLKKYYYDYQGKDVLIVSDLNIEMPNISKKNLCFFIDREMYMEIPSTWYYYSANNFFEIILRNIE